MTAGAVILGLILALAIFIYCFKFRESIRKEFGVLLRLASDVPSPHSQENRAETQR